MRVFFGSFQYIGIVLGALIAESLLIFTILPNHTETTLKVMEQSVQMYHYDAFAESIWDIDMQVRPSFCNNTN